MHQTVPINMTRVFVHEIGHLAIHAVVEDLNKEDVYSTLFTTEMALQNGNINARAGTHLDDRHEPILVSKHQSYDFMIFEMILSLAGPGAERMYYGNASGGDDDVSSWKKQLKRFLNKTFYVTDSEISYYYKIHSDFLNEFFGLIDFNNNIERHINIFKTNKNIVLDDLNLSLPHNDICFCLDKFFPDRHGYYSNKLIMPY